ncbi:hypothetical protein KKC59_03990, partial [bacterium]|nr:hypothetical protein [bacterium]
DLDFAKEIFQKKVVLYDRAGDGHYDTISAFIKSMRGSDPDAAVYWLAKMISGGEGIDFIGRRIAICASEDVGNADPHAVLVANACWETARKVGYPEANIPLAQAVIYIAAAPKSNASYIAIDAAVKDIESKRVEDIPAYLKSSDFKAKKDYKYAHDYKNNFVKQKYTSRNFNKSNTLPGLHNSGKKNNKQDDFMSLPSKFKQSDKIYYNPTENGYEADIKKRLDGWRGTKNEGRRTKDEGRKK